MSAGRLHNPRLLINSLIIKGLSARTSKAQDKGIKAYQKEVEKYEDKEKVSKNQEAALVKTRDTKAKRDLKKLNEKFTPEQLKRKPE